MTFKTFKASFIISGPTPSPAKTAILNSLVVMLSSFPGNMFHQAAVSDELFHKGRNRTDREFPVRACYRNGSFSAVDGDFFSFGNRVGQFLRFKNRQAHIEGVAIENTR